MARATSDPVRCPLSHPGPSATARSSNRPRSSDFTAALVRWAASSVSQETSARPTGDGDEQQQGCTESGDRQAVLEGADHHLGDEHGLRDDQPRADDSEADDRQQEDACGAGVPEQPRIDWFHVKHALRSR